MPGGGAVHPAFPAPEHRADYLCGGGVRHGARTLVYTACLWSCEGFLALQALHAPAGAPSAEARAQALMLALWDVLGPHNALRAPSLRATASSRGAGAAGAHQQGLGGC